MNRLEAMIAEREANYQKDVDRRNRMAELANRAIDTITASKLKTLQTDDIQVTTSGVTIRTIVPPYVVIRKGRRLEFPSDRQSADEDMALEALEALFEEDEGGADDAG